MSSMLRRAFHRTPAGPRSISWFGLLTTAVVGLSAACGQIERPAARPPLTDAPERARAYASPAKWRYHPSRAAPLLARVPVGDGRVLFAGERGERWLVDDEGRATPAALLAPEHLVAIQRTDGLWAFVGASGARYEADAPLGPFTGVSAPLDDLVELTVSGSVLLGVRRDGRLTRREGDAAWSVVGTEAERFVAVGFGEGGRGLALAVPEQLYETTDSGASWREMDGPTRGAIGIVADRQAGVVVDTVSGPLVWQPDGRLAPLGRAIDKSVHRLGVDVRAGPSGTALAAHRAFVVGERYVELRESDEKPLVYHLVQGPIGGELSARPAPAFDGCGGVRLFGSTAAWVGVCARDDGQTVDQPLTVFRSTDRGAHWHEEPFRVEGALAGVEVAVDDGGRTLLTGMCPTEVDRRCRVSGVLRREVRAGDEGAAPRLVKIRIPDLAGSAQGLSFGGKLALFIGRRSKNGLPALFVSDEGLSTFGSRPLARATRPERRSSDDAQPDVVFASGAEDGSTAFVIRAGRQTDLVVVDEAGTLLAESEPPMQGAAVGAAGVRALAIAPGAGEAFESLDAGATWRPIGRPPISVCKSGPECDVDLACHARGCVVGPHLSRVGWRGQADATSASEPRPLSRNLTTALTPSVKAPWVCALSEEPWAVLPARGRIPTADQAGFEGVEWYVLADDPADASVALAVVRRGARPHVEREVLLPPVERARDYAFAASLQVEGAAALRYRIPGGPTDASAEIRDVEVAWVDLIAKARGRGRIPQGGPLRPGDTEPGLGAADRARPALLSIGAGGVYVRLHGALGDNQPTYFLDGRQVERLAPASWPAALASFGRSEMARIGKEHVMLRLSEVTTSRRRAGGGSIDVMTLGFRHPADFGITQSFDIAYVDGRSALHATVLDEPRGRSYGIAWPFRAEGPVVGPGVRVPTQADLGERPRACSAKQRAETPRVVVPYHPGTRHPVVVSDPMGPLRILVTDRVVMHGTPAAACAEAFGAEPVTPPARRGAIETYGAILLPGAVERSWFFRSTKVDGQETVDVRPMRCQLDPSAEIPDEIYRAKGTAVR